MRAEAFKQQRWTAHQRAQDACEKPSAWTSSWTAVATWASRSCGADESAPGQKFAWPKIGRSNRSRWQVPAYAKTPSEHASVATAETIKTKSASAPSPAAELEHPEHDPKREQEVQTSSESRRSDGILRPPPPAAMPHTGGGPSFAHFPVESKRSLHERAARRTPSHGLTASAACSQRTACGMSSSRRKDWSPAGRAEMEPGTHSMRNGAQPGDWFCC